ncbi:DUF2268 domain-containing protein [Bacillus sp. Marseille-P3800]|uniref:DUF2268 domain-containing protein n=1 Tax=Bacillus sp. Marseille-P3800 TaxID=2014782 RepID=UPI00159BA509|nr:DUF2268 domain-containing putative Zn-dependent protease [Bacillus sp. Marseille-P3800]
MAVIRTNKWIQLFLKHADSQRELESTYLRLFVNPLQPLFQFQNDEQLAAYLQKVGLFTVNDREQLPAFIDHDYWSILQAQFLKLKQAWNGPNVPIYVLMANQSLENRQDDVRGMMGLSFENGILLLIPSSIEHNHLRALLTHEYHHVCRLSHTKESEQSITLLESMVMEGLAELAVKEYVGESSIAPWALKQKSNWKTMWNQYLFEKTLVIKGRKEHKDFLYGSRKKRIPYMMGYTLGYCLCQEAALQLGEKSVTLLTTPAEKIYRHGYIENGFKNNEP